ncbi:methionine aminopeptidase [Erysipelotrichaceae bacterium]|nr:methionine aminopeptidase [Erysipelotrichaceae bacterium]
MLEYKSKREIECMKEAGRIVALCHKELEGFIKVGVSLLEIDAFVENIIVSNGAIPSFKGYDGFPNSTCINVNEVIVHGIPSKQKLHDGDIVNVDIGAYYKGFHGDSGWTYAVGEISAENKRLMEVTEQALWKAIEVIKPGNSLRNIGKVIQQHVEANGFKIVKELAGHGVGRELHEEPMVLNYDTGMGDLILKEGLVIAVEPIVAIGTEKMRVLADGWTVVTVNKKASAQYEHTIAITADGCEILTTL